MGNLPGGFGASKLESSYFIEVMMFLQ